MKKQLFGLALAAAWMGSNTAWAQAPTTPAAPAVPAAPTAAPTADPAAPITPAAPRRGSQVQGSVTAVDTVKKTVTVTVRRTGTSTVLTLAPDVKVLRVQPATLGDIKTGSIVAAYGDGLTPGATAVTATRLVIQPADAPLGKPGPRAGYHRTYVQGTVAAMSPLTMTTAGGVTVTVTVAADTAVTKTVAGTAGDITVGNTVQARTTGDDASPTATEIRIVPAGAGRAARRQRPAAPATAVPATAIPTADAPAPAPAH